MAPKRRKAQAALTIEDEADDLTGRISVGLHNDHRNRCLSLSAINIVRFCPKDHAHITANIT